MLWPGSYDGQLSSEFLELGDTYDFQSAGPLLTAEDMENGTTYRNGRPVIDEKPLRFAGVKHKKIDDDDEDEDMDALIEELESLDPEQDIEEEVQDRLGAGAVPEEFLQTDTRTGLSEPEVIARRKKWGLNELRQEKENLALKFLGYFVGPIQTVMEVSVFLNPLPESILILIYTGSRHPCSRTPRLG
jgi:magnesium-transporting ATPase (P-type)